MRREKSRKKSETDPVSLQATESSSSGEATRPRKRQTQVSTQEPPSTTVERPRTRATTQLMAAKQPGTSLTRKEVRRQATIQSGVHHPRRRTEAELLVAAAQEAGYGAVIAAEQSLPTHEQPEPASPQRTSNRSTPVTDREYERANQLKPLEVPQENSWDGEPEPEDEPNEDDGQELDSLG